MRKLATAAFLGLVSLSAFAQEKLVESIEVRVVNVDVVVRDRAGKPVTGLTKDDFEIYDNGKKQTITNLYEIRPDVSPLPASGQPAAAATASAAEAPAELRQRKLVVFIDNYSLPPLRRNQIFQSLQKFVDREMRPSDQTMVVVWNQNLKIVNQFTSDKNVVKQSIASMADSSSAGFTNQSEVDQIKKRARELLDLAKEGRMAYSDAYSQSTGAIDAYAEHSTHSATRLLEALAKTTSALAGVDGKKVLVLAGAHLPERPGSELYTFVYNLFSNIPEFKIAFNTESLTGHSGQVHFSIEDTAKQAAANGVTLYMIDAADQRENASADVASKYLPDQTEQFSKFTNTAMAYMTLARITGGVAVVNSENFDFAFDEIARDFNSYYSLGYKPSEDATNGQRKLVVKVKNNQYQARTRESYSPKSTEQQMSDKVIANLYNEMKGDWRVEVRTGTPVKDGGKYKVPVYVAMTPTVTLLPKDEQMVGGFTVYIAVGNADGRSEVTKSPQSIKIAPAAEATLRAKPMTFGALVMMSPGENTVSIGVLDQISSSSGFARATVKAE